MRKFLSYAFAAVAAIVIVAPTQAADHPQKPGKWQMKFQMEMPSMPVKIPPVTTEMCVTEEDLKDPQKSLPSDQKGECTISDYKIDGNTVTWNSECPKKKLKGTGKVTYTADAYEGWMKITMDGQEMTTKYSGKWLGDCKK